jgi:anti-anti-sigma factor
MQGSVPMIEVASGWAIEVERGPGSLFIRVKSGGSIDPPEDLSQEILQAVEQHFASRVFLDLRDVQVIGSRLLAHVLEINRHICQQGGLLRVYGLNEFNRRVLAISGLDGLIPCYPDRHQAVMAGDLRKPR